MSDQSRGIIRKYSKRINAELLSQWQQYRSKLVIVTHINHAIEVDDEAELTSGYLLPELVRDDGAAAYKRIIGLG